jgi:transposase InsO family protein
MQQEKEAMEDITEYIEIFYNRKRIEEKLNYLPPIAYGQSFYKHREAV